LRPIVVNATELLKTLIIYSVTNFRIRPMPLVRLSAKFYLGFTQSFSIRPICRAPPWDFVVVTFSRFWSFIFVK